jgi:hypothetical protein
MSRFRGRYAKQKAKRLAAGVCVKCGKNPPAPGVLTCTGCRTDNNTRAPGHYQRRKAAGVCVKCGRGKPAPGKVCCEECGDGNAEYMRKWNRDIRFRLMSHYSGGGEPFCRGCGESMFIYLTIDHIDDDGAEHRRREVGSSKGNRLTGMYAKIIKAGFVERLQVLCWNCQWAKRLNGGVCPRTGVDLRVPPTPQELNRVRRR